VPGPLRGFLRARRPSFRLPVFRRILHEQRGDDRDNEIGDAEIRECRQHADGLNESRGHWRGDERAGTEPADGDPGDETASIGEPFYQNCNGNNVAQAKTEPSDESVTEIEPPQIIRREARQKNAEAIERSPGERDDPRPFSIHPQTAKERSEAEHENADGEGERDLRNAPAKLFRQRDAKHTPRVNGAQHDLEKHTGYRDHPAIRSFHNSHRRLHLQTNRAVTEDWLAHRAFEARFITRRNWKCAMQTEVL